jgi:hypothetical protein
MGGINIGWFTLFLFQLDTLFYFPYIFLQFSSYNFLYMFRTGWAIIRRIKLHVQPLAPFPRSLLSRAWPLVLIKWITQLAPTATHEISTKEGKLPEAARVIWFSWWWTSRSETCTENCKKKILNVKRKMKVYQVEKDEISLRFNFIYFILYILYI